MNIGETLAKARQEAGLTVAQVSARTRIRETVIRAIERDDFTLCGGNFYARGHIRGIARAIGIDPDPLIQAYDESHGGAPQAVPATQAFEPAAPVGLAERRSPNWSAAMAVALIFVLGYAVVRMVSGADPQQVDAAGAHQDAPPVATSTRQPDPADQKPAVKPPAPRDDVTVKLKAREDCWVNVRNEKNKVLFSGIVRAGHAMDWEAKKRIRLILGNPGGVTLTVNGENLGTPEINGRATRLSYGPEDPTSE